ncbi:2-alkenal reductase [Alicyclobacillus hesperidum subsp. aegles]|uniref:S1C family serine protease n=1 Tax=Alicyclobacillus hesperidum TaxID=89784 RepID=UPI00222A35A4|nr:trypsin-like peptidase domain-containing protein [Alicyclobacillus hesperidum]GLG00015.1 2-alkenal reductase [Alicyclobacillus hesperidum subsp. aegles]
MGRRFDEFDDWPGDGRRRRTVLLPSIVAGLAVFYVLGIWTGAAISHSGHQTTVEYVPSVASNGSGSGSSTTAIPGVDNTTLVTDIYNRVKNSIFTITAVSGGKSASDSGAEEDIGTGFLIDHNGDIATNAHVVGSAKTVEVSSGNRQYVGRVLNADKLDDLAIVRIPAPSSLQPLPLGSVKSLQPGSLVIAIGNPFELTSSVSSGIVSGLNRSMSESSGHVMNGMIQTDAPLNPGNSGGPLLNAAGQVVGINTLIESPIEGSIGIGFAIPIDRLIQLEPKLLSGQPIAHAWLGIEGMDIDNLMQEAMHLPVSSGVYVTETTKGGPAAKAGLQGDSNANKLNSANDTADPYTILKGNGDIIVGIDGEPVNSIEQLTQYINQDNPGQKVTLTVLRHGKKITIEVTLGTWPSGH